MTELGSQIPSKLAITNGQANFIKSLKMSLPSGISKPLNKPCALRKSPKAGGCKTKHFRKRTNLRYYAILITGQGVGPFLYLAEHLVCTSMHVSMVIPGSSIRNAVTFFAKLFENFSGSGIEDMQVFNTIAMWNPSLSMIGIGRVFFFEFWRWLMILRSIKKNSN